MSGRLILVAGPIGNLGDLSPRAVQALSDSDVWVVEDTRISAKLAAHLGLKKPMRVMNEHTPPAKIESYAKDVEEGSTVVVLTDGGAPGISDPGALLVDVCLDSGLEVDAIPGPSAVVNALMLSGFYAQRFAFLGFLPRKAGPAKTELSPFAESTSTIVLFESPHRIDATLGVCAQSLGSRRYAICRELTKMHQQVFRGVLPDLPSEKDVPRRGEFTLVIEGLRRNRDAELQAW